MQTLRKLATGSAAERFMNCPGSVALSRGIIESPKDYAEEGTRLHKEVEGELSGCFAEGDYIPSSDPFVQLCVDIVKKDVLPGLKLYLEQRLELLGSTGGIDCYWIDPVKRIAYLYDWKFGQGVRLEARNNEQMAFYACAIKDKHPEILKVYCTLIQPRLEGDFEGTAHVTHWIIPHQSIKAWRRKFERALLEVEKAESYKAGVWCKFCNAKPVCPAYVAFNDAVQEELLLPVLKEMSEAPASIEKIAWMVSQEKRITGWFPKAKEFLLELAERGIKIPGFDLVDKKANRQWHPLMERAEIIEKLRERGATEFLTEPELRSYTFFEKQKIDVSDLVQKPKAGKTLKLVAGEE